MSRRNMPPSGRLPSLAGSCNTGKGLKYDTGDAAYAETTHTAPTAHHTAAHLHPAQTRHPCNSADCCLFATGAPHCRNFCKRNICIIGVSGTPRLISDGSCLLGCQQIHLDKCDPAVAHTELIVAVAGGVFPST